MLSTLGFSLIAPWTGHHPPPVAAHQSFRYLAMWFFLTLWFMAKGTFKNVPDFAGDRAAGLRTSATVFGTRSRAALAATVATVSAYASLAGLVALGLEGTSILWSLVWLGPVLWNCARLLRAPDGLTGNRILRADMIISSGFIATLLLLVAPTVTSIVVSVAGALILFVSDFLALDSRREVDVPEQVTF
jgi:4-hydroxybenzoate polyprenyltransferase